MTEGEGGVFNTGASLIQIMAKRSAQGKAIYILVHAICDVLELRIEVTHLALEPMKEKESGVCKREKQLVKCRISCKGLGN